MLHLEVEVQVHALLSSGGELFRLGRPDGHSQAIGIDLHLVVDVHIAVQALRRSLGHPQGDVLENRRVEARHATHRRVANGLAVEQDLRGPSLRHVRGHIKRAHAVGADDELLEPLAAARPAVNRPSGQDHALARGRRPLEQGREHARRNPKVCSRLVADLCHRIAVHDQQRRRRRRRWRRRRLTFLRPFRALEARHQIVASALAECALALPEFPRGISHVDLLGIVQPLDCNPLIFDCLCGPCLEHRRQVSQGNVEAVDVDIVHGHHALLLYLVQIIGVCRVVFAFSEARGPQGDQLARGGTVEGVNLKTGWGDVGRVGRPLKRPRGVVHVHHEFGRRRILLHVVPVQREAAARARELHHLGARLLVRPFVFPVVNVEDAN